MDPLDFLETDALLEFFHCRKTELSCMENPHIFLSQLRDYNLIPEDRYKNVTHRRSKDNMRRELYEILDWLERERPKHIDTFWECVFQDTILNHYPTLQRLRQSLMDGSYRRNRPLPETEDNERKEARDEKEKERSDEETRGRSGKRKRKLRSTSTCDGDEEQQPSSSSQPTPHQRKKSKKIRFSSPLKRGEKNDIWTWPMYQSQLPVTCGPLEATLKRDRLAKGQKCILYEKQWFTPGGFEKFAGKESSKNWKVTIRCVGTPLQKLLQEGHLKSSSYKRGHRKAKKALFPPDPSTTESDGEDEDEDEDEEGNLEDPVSSSRKGDDDEDDEEDEEEAEQQTPEPEAGLDRSRAVFKVTCGALAGALHKKRFASAIRGKSIRTKTSWVTPEEFVKEALGQADVSWKKDIKWEGRPLNVLIEKNVLLFHSLLCKCPLCDPGPEDMEDGKNDDECCICKSEEEELVVCDHCPRSFHQRCHLPHVEDTMLRDDTEWMCTFCVFKTAQACRYTDEPPRDAAAVMSRQISQHMLECPYLLLSLCSADEEQTFATDPGRLQGYSTVIQTPMWLGRVADKLQQRRYQTIGEFVSDIQLIFTNCAAYNRDNAEFLAMGEQLKQLFDRELKKAFNICDQTADGETPGRS